MTDDILVWRSAVDLARDIRDKKVSPVEVTEAVLARIEALNPQLNAFCLITADVARRAAREAEIAVMKGEPLGRLHGIPVSIKDVIFTRGVRTTGGSRLFADMVPEEDAVAVARLRAAGGVMLGKTNTSEFGYVAVTENLAFGATRNPWNLACTPGGSSGGAAAAVASGLGPLALGTDSGGSVRIPAAFCGVYGLKPSYGRVPEHPTFPGWEHVSHLGIISRGVRDAALMLDVVAGADDRDRRSLPRETGSYLDACEEDIKGRLVAWTPDLGYAAVDSRVRAICETAAAEFESLGCHVEVVNPGWTDPEAPFRTIVSAQFYAAWSDQLPAAESQLDPKLVAFIRRGGAVTAREYLAALREVERSWLEAQTFLSRFDLMLTPTVAVPPFEAAPPREIGGAPVSVLGWMPFTYPFNLTGQPAASVPAGWTEDGLPVGLQIVGQLRQDRMVLTASAAFEAACPWREHHPRL